MAASTPIRPGEEPTAHPAHQDARHRRRQRERPRITLNLTAMIDVTFLLLVYFMVATQFRLGEEVYRLDLPEQRASDSIRDPFELDEEPLRIRLASTGPGFDRYRIEIEGPYGRQTSFEALFGFLRERQINDDNRGGLFTPAHPIIIEPAETTKWQHVLGAFDAAARARYTNVILGQAG